MKIRQLLWIMTAALFLVGCHKKEVTQTTTVVPLSLRTTAQTDNLLGQVKSTVEKKYMAIGYLDSTVLYAIHYKFYSKEGWLVDDVILNADSDTVFHTHVSYDDKGRMKRSDMYDSTGMLREHTEYEVDAHGYRTKETYYVGDSIARVMTFKNDAYGNVLQTVVKTAYEITMNYSYDAAMPGLPVRIDELGPDGNMFMYITMDYNDRGDLVNRRAFSSNGAEAESSHAQYGDRGEILKESHQISLKNLGKFDMSTYENHDTHGNWLKQVTTRQNVPYFTIERTIQYY